MNQSPYFLPAVLVSYDQNERTAMVSIPGLTDGAPEGIPAMLAYPIGDDDLDTERELIPGADVWVFFEKGDPTMPVIAFYRRHGRGRAVTDVRRIRQENIELLARDRVTINGDALVEVNGETITLTGQTIVIKASQVIIEGDISHKGNQSTQGTIAASTNVVGGGVSLNSHTHSGVKSGNSNTSGPN